MIILRHRLTHETARWPEGEPYNGREWEAIDSTTAEDLTTLEKMFVEEGLLLGDAIAKATSYIGMTPCAPCKRRQDWLNEFHRRGRDFVKEIVAKLKS